MDSEQEVNNMLGMQVDDDDDGGGSDGEQTQSHPQHLVIGGDQ